ncbi:MAG: response regulator transcription factor, partial [bacterium]
MNARILIVEDEDHIARGLKINLAAEGYQVEHVVDGLVAIDHVLNESPDLVLLDVMLPGASGFEVAERVRSSGSHVPILFLTARDREDDKIQGLEAGGDDYLTKPFSLRELLGRVHAILRRQGWYNAPPKQGATVSFGGSTVNFSAYRAQTPHGPVELTQKECMLLKLLVEMEGEVVTRETILDTVWGYDRFPTSRTIDNLILNLRRHFEENPKQPRHILTQYGAGYR